MRYRRITACLLSIAMIIGSVPSLVMAETEEPVAEDAADIYEDQAERKAGDSITWKLEDRVLLQSS